MERIGFYGGCFNPPTRAHIELAKKALKECNLDKIIFVPVGDLYSKEGMALGVHRYNMLKLACDGEEKLQVSDIEIKSNKDYKAIDIFEILQDQNKENENFFLMGADNLKNIFSWKESNKLVKDFNYIILDRGTLDAKNIIENDENLRHNKERFTIIDNKDFKECSSTYIRKKLTSGEHPADLDNGVYDYIRKNNIY